METVQSNYERWLDSGEVSPEDKETLRHMGKEEKDDAFFRTSSLAPPACGASSALAPTG